MYSTHVTLSKSTVVPDHQFTRGDYPCPIAHFLISAKEHSDDNLRTCHPQMVHELQGKKDWQIVTFVDIQHPYYCTAISYKLISRLHGP